MAPAVAAWTSIMTTTEGPLRARVTLFNAPEGAVILPTLSPNTNVPLSLSPQGRSAACQTPSTCSRTAPQIRPLPE